ncbi:D-alanyl-D-alanine carboxypeptidase [Paucibacter sp. APW11]|uniref:D-alanyl-D-alanine carboxypeptidase n=1 Tax=Roseateles aquae TaxID=3077235 RepID=A0ABU3PBM0_9BURK|nr:D-alanyl-D-alanine carboxypeptidase [Paucibacter sp. APW11]MDT8999645.1 D-alanyl-D-alanine carboxypeptidase [Paucibacter sp. APW11]
MSAPVSFVRRAALGAMLFAAVLPVAQAKAPGLGSDLPTTVLKALQAAHVPADALSVTIEALDGEPRLVQHLATQPRNPASLFKLVTSMAGLELLGPAWTWATPVWLQGQILPGGVLDGDLVIKGSGDPKLVQERLWLMLRQLQRLGVREIRGNIVLDSSAFAPSIVQPGDFDGEPWRAGNVQPAALLFNYKVQTYFFRPDPAQGLAWVEAELPLGDPQLPASVPLIAGPCDDWRSTLKPNWSNAAKPRFGGALPAACGEMRWPAADWEPASFNARLLAGLWQQMGGRLGGRVIDGLAPATAPSFELRSPPLAELLRDINKFSNNLMAEQLFLSLVQPADGVPVTVAMARERLSRWLAAKLGDGDFVIDNGSGLSRQTRLSATQLARLLRLAWQSPLMPELMATLPLSGVDGTLQRLDARAIGAAQARAHLKTGSLRDVQAVAGMVQSSSGRRWLLVAIINHPQAGAARPVLDALQRWVAEDLSPSAAP